MSLDAIERAVQRDKVLLPAGKNRSPSSSDPRYHEPASPGSLTAACNQTLTDMQAVDRAFAQTRFEPCPKCEGGN